MYTDNHENMALKTDAKIILNMLARLLTWQCMAKTTYEKVLAQI